MSGTAEGRQGEFAARPACQADVQLEVRLAAMLRSREVAVIAVFAAAIRIFWIFYVDRPPVVGLDFSSFCLWARALRNNHNPYQIDLRPYADSL
jgi:hypothetical protein